MSVVGIDLGTTNTVVGCVRSGKVHVLADDKGSRLLPSVVNFHPNGEVLVGGGAKARRTIDARNTVYSHKRLIGRSWGSPEIAQAKNRFPFELREGPGQGPLIHARGQDYTLPEISAFVLKRARQIAEAALQTPVERAVITVPAHFNELQRASTKVAGRVSGLEVLRILNEPTAAALAYGLGRTGNERVAVYDFGGGTFDCTLLDLNGNVFEVLATAGDSFLGGDDVDNLIADRMAEVFLKQFRQDARQDPESYERLRVAAEEVKIALSSTDTHTVIIRELGHGAGGAALNFQFTLSRKELDALVTPLADRTFKVTQDALALARLSPTSFDKVILVGGTTRMPVIRKRVEAFFGSQPMDRVNPDEVVAIGAAIQAAALTEGMRRRSIPAPPGAPKVDKQEFTQTSEFDPAMLKPAFGSSPPGFGFGSQQAGSQAPGDNKFAFASTVGNPQPPVAPNESHAPNMDLGRTQEGFGAIDEPPSLSMEASFPSFPSMSSVAKGVPSPLGGEEAPAWQKAPPLQAPPPQTQRLSQPDGGFGHVEDLSLISTSTSTAAMEAITQARTQTQSQLEAESKGNTLQIDPAANPNAPKEDSLIDRADLPAVVAKAKPARKPGQLGMNPQGNTMLGKPPPLIAPQPFGPMEKMDEAPPPPSQRPRPVPPGGKAPPQIARRPSGSGPAAAPVAPGSRPDLPPMTAPVAQQPPRQAPPATMASPQVRPSQPNQRVSQPPQQQPPPLRQPPPIGQQTHNMAAVQPPPTQAMPQAQPARRAPEAFAQTTASPAQPQPPHQQPINQTALGPYASAPPPMQGMLSSPPPQHQPFSFGSGPPPGMGSAPPPHQAGQSQPPIFGAYSSAPPAQQGPLPDHGPSQFSAPPPQGAPMPPGSQPQLQATLAYSSPVLVDVTPRGLLVETAGGYVDTIIPRNSKIPCERTRRFATGRDMQTSVRVRVAQGEGSMFAQNTFLGEVELSGLRPAARGEVTVAVTFEVDADGTLRVRARDVQTGQEARATLRLEGVADESSVVMMINRFATQPVVGGQS